MGEEVRKLKPHFFKREGESGGVGGLAERVEEGVWLLWQGLAVTSSSSQSHSHVETFMPE